MPISNAGAFSRANPINFYLRQTNDVLKKTQSSLKEELKSVKQKIGTCSQDMDSYKCKLKDDSTIKSLNSLKKGDGKEAATLRLKDGKFKLSEGGLKGFLHKTRYLDEKREAYNLFGKNNLSVVKKEKVSLNEALGTLKGLSPLANSEINGVNHMINACKETMIKLYGEEKSISKELDTIEYYLMSRDISAENAEKLANQRQKDEKKTAHTKFKNFSTLIHSEPGFNFLQNAASSNEGNFSPSKVLISLSEAAKAHGFYEPFLSEGKNKPGVAGGFEFKSWVKGLTTEGDKLLAEVNNFIKANSEKHSIKTVRGIGVGREVFNQYCNMKENAHLTSTRLFCTSRTGDENRDKAIAESFAKRQGGDYTVIFEVNGKPTTLSPIHYLTYASESTESVYASGSHFRINGNPVVDGKTVLIPIRQINGAVGGLEFPH